MEGRIINLDCFKCALSFDEEHYIEKGVTLPCGHCACYNCLHSFKENTGFGEFKCGFCEVQNSLDVNYCESILLKNVVESNLKYLLSDLKSQYEETFKRFKNKQRSMNEFMSVQVEHARKEIETRADYLKAEIDKSKEVFINKLNKIKSDYEKETCRDNSCKYEYMKECVRVMAAGTEMQSPFDQKFFENCQNDLKKLKRSLKYLESIDGKISLTISKYTFPEELIGSISYNFEDMIEKFVKTKHQMIGLDIEPKDFCQLPNGNVLIASRTSKNLKIYDENFKFIKTIDRINCQTFTPLSIATNGRNFIYVADEQFDKILQTDLEFNMQKAFGSRGSELEQLCSPLDIIYDKNSVYVCDTQNQRIQKLSEDLQHKKTYPLNFKPWKIKIAKNIACIRPTGEPFISFFNLTPFCLKAKVSDGNGDIFSINSCFYEYEHPSHRLRCYDINGELLKETFLKFECGLSDDSMYWINVFKQQFIIGLTQTKKIIF